MEESKHKTAYTTPPAAKRPQLTAKGNVTGTAQQMGLSIFVPDASACWSHGWLQVMLCLFVFIYEVIPNLLTKRVVGMEGDITILGFIYRKLDGVHCK